MPAIAIAYIRFAFFPFKVGERVREIVPPFRHGQIVKIFHPGPRAIISVHLDGLGIVQLTPNELALE